jgi:transcription factor Dp-1
VYDALNVLMAMDIISKEKKEIRWKGLPSNAHHDLEILERERDMKLEEVARKKELLRDLIMQGVRYDNLVKRNVEVERGEGEGGGVTNGTATNDTATNDTTNTNTTTTTAAAANTNTATTATSTGNNDATESVPDDKIPIPFIVVNTSSETVIQCEMGSDRTDVFFNFSQPFEINDDNEILKRLGMDRITEEGLKELLDDEVFDYVRKSGLCDEIVTE